MDRGIQISESLLEKTVQLYSCYVAEYVSKYRPRAHTGPGKPGKSWNFVFWLSKPGKSWNFV